MIEEINEIKEISETVENAAGNSTSIAEVGAGEESGKEVEQIEEIYIPDLKYKLEGILFAAERALGVKQLRALFPEEEAPSVRQVQEALGELQQDYAERGVRLVEVASGFCFRATSLIAPYIGELMGEKPVRYSRALLETLAIIAYRQPLTRGEIEQIRGVAVSSQILKTLQEREWIKVVGVKEVPGKPELLATTKAFLDYFHLQHLSDLPELAELIDQDPQAAELALEEQLALAKPEAVVENVGENISEVILEVIEENISEAMLEIIPEVMSEVEPEIMSEVEPEVMSELELEVTSELELEVMSELELEVTSELELEVTSELEPEVTSELEPEVTSELEPEVIAEEEKN